MRVINLIPKNYEGNPRNAMGYCWAKYVSISESWTEAEKEAHPWDGCGPDVNKSIPGEDLKITVQECLDMLESEHGKIALRNNGSYGWLKTTAETRDGKEIDIDGLTPIASVHGMWCGGINADIYIIPENCEKVEKTDHVESAGETIEETAAIEKMTERLDVAELDNRYEHNVGWCKICHSFCYGDCQANK